MKTIIFKTATDIKRFLDVLNEYNRAPLSAYWQVCYKHGTYLDELEYPVSRTVLGEIEKRTMNLIETGKMNTRSKSYNEIWSRFNNVIARHLRKIGLVSLEKESTRTFVNPLIRSIILKVGQGIEVEKIEDPTTALRLVRNLIGSSRNRQNFDKRLRYEIKDTVEIIFPGLEN